LRNAPDVYPSGMHLENTVMRRHESASAGRNWLRKHRALLSGRHVTAAAKDLGIPAAV
jgi:hypothetical protein